MKTLHSISWVSSISVMSLVLTCGLISSAVLGDVVLNPPPDVDKPFVSNPSLPNDMTCWMATASNMLAGAGYGSGLSTQARADDIYADMVAQWGTGQGGWPDTALTWWLNSTHNNKKTSPYKTVVPQGHKNQTPWLEPNGPRIIGNHLRDWEYVGIVIYNGLYHAITVWGDEDALGRLTSNPAQIWVADSDRDVGGDIQHYTYDAYSATGGWRFNYYTPSRTRLSKALRCCVLSTPPRTIPTPRLSSVPTGSASSTSCGTRPTCTTPWAPTSIFSVIARRSTGRGRTIRLRRRLPRIVRAGTSPSTGT